MLFRLVARRHNRTETDEKTHFSTALLLYFESAVLFFGAPLILPVRIPKVKSSREKYAKDKNGKRTGKLQRVKVKVYYGTCFVMSNEKTVTIE